MGRLIPSHFYGQDGEIFLNTDQSIDSNLFSKKNLASNNSKRNLGC